MSVFSASPFGETPTSSIQKHYVSTHAEILAFRLSQCAQSINEYVKIWTTWNRHNRDNSHFESRLIFTIKPVFVAIFLSVSAQKLATHKRSTDARLSFQPFACWVWVVVPSSCNSSGGRRRKAIHPVNDCNRGRMNHKMSPDGFCCDIISPVDKTTLKKAFL